MSDEPRRWTISVCPHCGEEVYSDGYFPCPHDTAEFCLAHPEYPQEVDKSGAHKSLVDGEWVRARSLEPREVEVVEAALPDDRLARIEAFLDRPAHAWTALSAKVVADGVREIVRSQPLPDDQLRECQEELAKARRQVENWQAAYRGVAAPPAPHTYNPDTEVVVPLTWGGLVGAVRTILDTWYSDEVSATPAPGDDDLREKVAAAIEPEWRCDSCGTGYMSRLPGDRCGQLQPPCDGWVREVPLEERADEAIRLVRGVSATLAPPDQQLLECEEALRSTEREFADFREQMLAPLKSQHGSIESLSWNELLGVAVRNLNEALDLGGQLDEAQGLLGRAAPFVNAVAAMADDKAPALAWLADAAAAKDRQERFAAATPAPAEQDEAVMAEGLRRGHDDALPDGRGFTGDDTADNADRVARERDEARAERDEALEWLEIRVAELDEAKTRAARYQASPDNYTYKMFAHARTEQVEAALARIKQFAESKRDGMDDTALDCIEDVRAVLRAAVGPKQGDDS